MELQVILLVEKQDLAVRAINIFSPWKLLGIGVHENRKSSQKNKRRIINFEVEFIKIGALTEMFQILLKVA